MPRYKIMVDDNFHYQDPDARREHGTYASLEEAIAACRAIVNESLKEFYKAGISAEALYEGYVSFGDDPFIVVVDGADANAKFSAWGYAKERCAAMCAGN